MLIKFTFENWMSFRDETSFSMIATRERQHGNRIARINKYRMRLLPIAAIYGGNASGKTNLFEALRFAKEFIVSGTGIDAPIPIERFRLDPEAFKRPARFTFEILVDETMYEFSFAVTQNAVVEEKLVQITSTSETDLYVRQDREPSFDQSLPERQRLTYAFENTRDNELFLTNSIDQNIEMFRPVYNWFKDILELISPDSWFVPVEQFLDEDAPLHSQMNEILSQLDTGISCLDGEDIPFDALPLPDQAKSELRETIKEGTRSIFIGPSKRRFLIVRENDQLTAKKIVTRHLSPDGEENTFDMNQESDGTVRLIDLGPAFLELSRTGSKKVYVIDELDRSLHTLATRRLLELYLESCTPESRSQLLFSTHDVLLMDQQLFRRDEMWITERNAAGVSSLLSFSEYKDVRDDKDIRRSYLQGRMGGIPRILLSGSATVPCRGG